MKYLRQLAKYQLSDGFFTYRAEHPSNFQSTYMALKISARNLLDMELFIPSSFHESDVSSLGKSEQVYYINNYFMITKKIL